MDGFRKEAPNRENYKDHENQQAVCRSGHRIYEQSSVLRTQLGWIFPTIIARSSRKGMACVWLYPPQSFTLGSHSHIDAL
jgi:hypothetical protein